MRTMNLVRSDPTTTMMPRVTTSSAIVVTRDPAPWAVVVVEVVLAIWSRTWSQSIGLAGLKGVGKNVCGAWELDED